MTLHLARIAIDPQALRTYAAMTRTNDDDGLYATHHALRMRFGDRAPQPFSAVLTGPEPHVVGYLPADHVEGLTSPEPSDDPILQKLFGGGAETRPMPVLWSAGVRLSFRLRARPVVRYSQRTADLVEASTGWRPMGGEIDAVIAAGRKSGSPADPAKVCRDWLARRLEGAATLETFILRDYRRVSSRRSNHGGEGPRMVTGPDATMAGTLSVVDADAFGRLVARGVGRHAAFGYGMIMVSPAR